MAEVGGLCEWGLRCQGRWNGKRNHPKASEALVLRGRLEAVAGFLLNWKRWLRVFSDNFCLLQLPDDVKQNIEDAGARYIPYVPRLSRATGHAC